MTTETIKETAHGCGIVYQLGENGLYVEFYAAKIEGEHCWENGVYKGDGYAAKDSSTNMPTVYDPADAERFVSGSVKWDGCVNFECGDQSRVMMHACGKDDLARLSAVLLTIYDRCREILGDKADW